MSWPMPSFQALSLILLAEQFNLLPPSGLIQLIVNVLFMDWLKLFLTAQKESEESEFAQRGPYTEERSHHVIL